MKAEMTMHFGAGFDMWRSARRYCYSASFMQVYYTHTLSYIPFTLSPVDTILPDWRNAMKHHAASDLVQWPEHRPLSPWPATIPLHL